MARKRRSRKNSRKRQRINLDSAGLSRLTHSYLSEIIDKFKKRREFPYGRTTCFKRDDRLHGPRKSPPRRRRDKIRHKDQALKRPVRDLTTLNKERQRQRETHLRSENTRRICTRRVDRRNALFALRIAGRGKGGPKSRRMTPESKVRC